MNILIVDDDEVFLDKIQKILTLNHYKIVTANSGNQALTKIDGNYYDLILTDLKMPGLSGVELIKKIREKGIQSMIIVITGYGTIESAVDSIKAGAYDYILKPFEISILWEKIKEVERELELRKRLNVLKITEGSEIGESFDLNTLNDYDGPFLLISDEKPDKFINGLHLSNITSIWLNYEGENDSIIPSKLHFLKSRIDNFVKKNQKGIIIFKGIEELLNTHKWIDLKKFIIYLQNEVITSNFSLLILVKEDKNILNNSQQSLLNDALSLLVNPVFNKIINLLSHPLRKDIISLLSNEEKLNYNKILKKLDVGRSSVLAFHLNKLLQENLLIKKNNSYLLNSRGLYFSEIIFHLEKLGFSYPESQVKLFKIAS